MPAARRPLWKLALVLAPFATAAVAINLFLVSLMFPNAGLPVQASWQSLGGVSSALVLTASHERGVPHVETQRMGLAHSFLDGVGMQILGGEQRTESLRTAESRYSLKRAESFSGLSQEATILGLIAIALLCLVIGLRWPRHSRALRAINFALSEVGRGRFNTRISTERLGGGFREAAEAINALLDRWQNSTQSLNYASAEIAHTLKRPLIGLRHRLENVRERELDKAQFIEIIDSSIAEIDSMVGMFETILDIAQIEGGDVRLRFTDVDLKSVLLKLIDVYEAVIQDSGHRLTAQLGELDQALISGDAALLFQMFNNLVENAILYCPVGTTITISLAATGGEFVATIADNGPGLSEEDRRNVFRPFFRPVSTQQAHGHGLGIPLVAAIVRLHHARIALEDNAPGLSASVYFAPAKKRRH